MAKLFWNGRSQAVRLPQEFRFDGDQVRIRREGKLVVLEPMTQDPAEWLTRLTKFRGEPFMKEGRKQPKPQKRESFE